MGEDKLEQDHKYPLSKANEDFLRMGTKKVYAIDDIQPLCRICNSKKHRNIAT